jgi:hypothetical protein
MEEIMNNSIITAAPLMLKSLSQQIQDAGGEGFNCSVKVERIKNSFSEFYHFDTPSGPKTIKTLNRFTVGMIDDAVNHFVEFDGDTKEYSLVTPHSFKKPPYKLLKIKDIGSTFEDMFNHLKAIWPDRVVWKLTEPSEALASRVLEQLFSTTPIALKNT